MSTVLIDRVAAVVFHNNILRFDCIASGPEGIERHSGTLLIPANQVAAVLQSLAGATGELDKRLREQAEAAAASAAEPAAVEKPAKPAKGE
jgi:hypothetical protein